MNKAKAAGLTQVGAVLCFGLLVFFFFWLAEQPFTEAVGCSFACTFVFYFPWGFVEFSKGGDE